MLKGGAPGVGRQLDDLRIAGVGRQLDLRIAGWELEGHWAIIVGGQLWFCDAKHGWQAPWPTRLLSRQAALSERLCGQVLIGQ